VWVFLFLALPIFPHQEMVGDLLILHFDISLALPLAVDGWLFQLRVSLSYPVYCPAFSKSFLHLSLVFGLERY